MLLDITKGSWEFLAIESVLDNRDAVADLLMWERDTFDSACNNIAKQLQQENVERVDTDRNDVDMGFDRKITATQLSVAYIESQIGLVESNESLTSDEYKARIAGLESDRALCQKELDVLWSLRKSISDCHKHNSDDHER